jgi:phosphonate transport system substrate-binding protein
MILSIFLLATFFGYKTGPETVFQIKPDENTIVFAITPWGEARKSRKAYDPLLQYLSAETGIKFQPLVMEDYNATIDNIAEGNLDIAVMPPVSFIKAKELEPGIQYISTIKREESGNIYTTYKGYLVALKNKYSGWTFDDFLKDAKKYTIAFVTKPSSSGWAYPMAMMKKLGLNPGETFKEVLILDNHPSVTDSIANGTADIGATWEYNLEQAVKKHGDIFSIIYTTPDIPGLAWVASKKTDPKLIEKIRRLQMQIDSSQDMKEKLLKDTPDKGWAVLNESFYNDVREVLKYVGDFQ